jgi:hypothetical protein
MEEERAAKSGEAIQPEKKSSKHRFLRK